MNILNKIKTFITSYKAIAFCDIIALLIVFIYSGVLLLDELEHLHAAYFISTGSLPFRDFFEHHHPTLLFLLSSFIKLLPQNTIMVLYIARLFMTLFSIGTFYYIYKLANRFLGGKLCALLGILIFMSFYPTLYMFSIVKPDTIMQFFFMCGLYYFFEYTRTLKTKALIICFSAFTLSFLFLQTAVFLILPLCFLSFYILYKNPKQIRSFLWALPIPLALVGLFILYLYSTDSLDIYFQSCWIFNAKFFSLLDFRLPSVLPDFSVYIILGYIAYGYLIHKKEADFYVHSLAILLSFALLKNLIYTAYYPRYLLPCFFYSSLLIASSLKNAPPKMHGYLKLTLFAILLINISITFILYSNKASISILDKIKPSDTCFNYYANEQNIYQPLYSYYWYAPSIESVDDYLFNRHPDYNITEVVKSVKFKYILYNKEAYNQKVPRPYETSDKQFKATYQRHTLDDAILNDYEYIGNNNIGLYKRKY